MSPKARRSGWWEQLTLYLPVVIMGFLALGTWWLVRSSPQPLRLDVSENPSAGPQYKLHAFTTQSFDPQGRLRGEVIADFAQYDGQTDTLVMQGIRLRSVDEQGRVMQAEADQARANNALDRFSLLGRARAWQVSMDKEKTPAGPQPGWVFQGEQLEFDGQTKQLRSQGPARLQRGKDSLSAQQMQYDDTRKRLSMQGQVRAVFHRSAGPAGQRGLP